MHVAETSHEQTGNEPRTIYRNKISGAQGRDRTTDTVIFSHVLYQLSYLGAEPRHEGGAWIEARGL